MKVLNLLTSGGVGGIEKLCLDIGMHAKYDNCFCCLFDNGTIYEEMKEKGINVVSLRENGHSKFSFNRLIKLYMLAKDFDIIVVHHNAIVIQVYYLFLHAMYPKKKFAMTIHSCFEPTYYYNYKNVVKRITRKITLNLSLNKSDLIVYVSKAGKSSYESCFNLRNKNTTVIYNGVELITSKENLEKKKDETIRITYIGRLVQEKGVHLLIDAILLLTQKGVPCKLVIVGDGNFREELENRVEKNGIREFVRFEGQQRNLQKYFCNTDIFAYPSICQEVFGLSIVEAMAYGIPCVAFRVGGIPEIVKNGKNGWLSDEKTAEGLMNAIENLSYLLKISEKGEIQGNCRKTAGKFSIDRTVMLLESKYNELLK